MRSSKTTLAASVGAAAVILAFAPTASAQVRHHHRIVRAYHAAYGYAGYGRPSSGASDATLNGNAFNAGAAQIPLPGTYNNYYGPGATVLRRGLAAQFEPGVTEELFPDAKQTATGGPVGGASGTGGGR